MLPIKDGYLACNKHRVYYKIIGRQSDAKKLPLLVIAGGPGSPHNYLLDLQQIAQNGRQVIFYDQLGCGNSDHPTDNSIWGIGLFIDEIKTLRDKLKLKNVHILGHSWGGMLAIDYMLAEPSGVHGLILASSMISVPLFEEEMARLRKALPRGVDDIMKKHEASGDFGDPEYKQAYSIFSKKRIFRGEEWPPHLNAPPNSFGNGVYTTMWGPNEAYINGTLSQWDRKDRLREISVPTLITSGYYDELTPKQAGITKANIPNSKQVLFQNSAHMPHIEEPSAYRASVERFLEDIEQHESR
jgi:proline-specific peptidase